VTAPDPSTSSDPEGGAPAVADVAPAEDVAPAPDPPVPRSLLRRLARYALRVVAVLYIAGIYLEGVGSDLPASIAPPPLMYFMVVAALFPSKSTAASEYRAEGWVCAEDRWMEIDTRRYFPLDPDDKENRFQRALHFYHDYPVVVGAIEAYLIDRHNRAWDDDGIPRDRPIGGVKLLVVREPIPTPGGHVRRYERRALVDLPSKVQHPFYETPKHDIEQRCGHAAPTDEAAP